MPPWANPLAQAPADPSVYLRNARARVAAATAAPNANPPTWATHATPEFGAKKNCDKNQNPKSHAALIRATKGMMMTVTSVVTRALGYNTT